VLVSPNYPCLNISRPQTIAAAGSATDEAGPPVFRSVVMQCGTTKYLGTNGVTAAQVQTVFGAGANGNSDTFIPSLTGGFINGATENAVTAFDISAIASSNGSAFFDKPSFIGAVKSSAAADAWYTGWTCNSATANFGTGNSGLCTSLPTT
jgi:hypothetical protein